MKFLKFLLCFFTIFFHYSASAFSSSNSLSHPKKSMPTKHWLIDFSLPENDSIIYALNTTSSYPNDSVLYMAERSFITKLMNKYFSLSILVTMRIKKYLDYYLTIFSLRNLLL